MKKQLSSLLVVAALVLSACSSDPDAATDDTTETAADDATVTEPGTATTAATPTTSAASCEDVAALFVTGGSVNADLPDPVVSATCDGDSFVVSANGIPDYTYVRTSPGDPNEQDLNYSFPATPVFADAATDVPALGSLGITLAGVPIYGPTEGTGGDVLSLEGALSECGSHNGPTGFHLHLLGTSSNTDCDFTPEEVEAGPQLLGYAFDGFPIYTGNAQYTSSWSLTDDTLFATDTWSAHSYTEGSGDLDECNGLIDEAGNYAYYTTDTFPYVLGCFAGAVDIGDDAGRGGPPPDGQ